MADDESTRGPGKRQLPEGIEQYKSVARESTPDNPAPRRGIPGKGFGGGSTAYGDNTGAYSSKSSYGGQAGYGGSRMNGAYSDGKYGRDQTHLHVTGDEKHAVEDQQPGLVVDEGASEMGDAADG